MASLDDWLRAAPTPVGIAPGDPLFEAVVTAHDVRQSARLTQLGIKAASGRDVPVDFTHYDPTTAKETAVGAIHWARMYPDSEALVYMGMGKQRSAGPRSPAAMARVTKDVQGFDYGDYFYGNDYRLRLTDLHAAFVGSPMFFTPDGRADLLATAADALESRMPDVSQWGAIPIILHELGHARELDAMRQGLHISANIGPGDREAAAKVHWRAALSSALRGPVGLDTPQGRWATGGARRAMSPAVAGAQNQDAHVPPGMMWALDDKQRNNTFRSSAAHTKREAYPDALMTLMMQGEAAGWQIRSMARALPGSNVDRLIAGAPGLRAAVTELRERSDPATAAPVREQVRLSARTVGAEVAHRAPGTVARLDRTSPPAAARSDAESVTVERVDRVHPRHRDALDPMPVLPQLPRGRQFSSGTSDPSTDARLAVTSYGFGAAANTQAQATSVTPTRLPDTGDGARTTGVARIDRDPSGPGLS
ncbi:hypothetical protein OG948_41985 (plasmid) [Embleya sp. NBC_00888]|uniref:hypothetical protein n=1 Tax=Embleya sp. NBC_00888 TaxID=2975960 RepID=UPI002F9135E8|nr:hypothetical protein OG948_41985 [Embleya sp. NBC_00888]